MNNHQTHPWVLAIDPWRCGFGFAFFEGPDRLIDWGLRIVPEDNRKQHYLARFRTLLDEHQPNIVVLEDWSDSHCRRGQRVQNLFKCLAAEAKRQRIKVQVITPRQIKQTMCLPGLKNNKHAIARQMAARYPELSPRLPPQRKPWMSEDSRMAIFDACAFAFTFYQTIANAKHALPSDCNSFNS